MARVLCPILQLLWTCWILMCLNLMSCSGKLVEEEKKALLELRDSLNYPNGSALINEWIEEDYCAWAALCKLRNLKELDLSFNPLNGDALPHFQVCSLTSLEQLHLSGVYPSSPLPLLRALCGLKDTRRLDLSNNNLTDDSMPHCLFDDLSYLESLELSGNNLKNSHHILSALCRLQNLKRLDLSDNFLDDGSIPTCLFEKNSVLESLDISHNNIRGSPGFFS
ncbi:hypothetical protein HAX54_022038, partial [Datura stramonium]|nr:hypothetical protein [Datura stramonium]